MEASPEFLTALIHAPGPPAQEGPVRDVLTNALDAAGIKWTIDARGNLLAAPGNTIPEKPRIVVTAHMDEIALMVRQINPDGTLSVLPLGGAHPWKWGEGPVDILCGETPLQGVLSLDRSTQRMHPRQSKSHGMAKRSLGRMQKSSREFPLISFQNRCARERASSSQKSAESPCASGKTRS